jgi:hypothetical protein
MPLWSSVGRQAGLTIGQAKPGKTRLLEPEEVATEKENERECTNISRTGLPLLDRQRDAAARTPAADCPAVVWCMRQRYTSLPRRWKVTIVPNYERLHNKVDSFRKICSNVGRVNVVEQTKGSRNE